MSVFGTETYHVTHNTISKSLQSKPPADFSAEATIYENNTIQQVP